MNPLALSPNRSGPARSVRGIVCSPMPAVPAGA
jgi:hypothetical protein